MSLEFAEAASATDLPVVPNGQKFFHAAARLQVQTYKAAMRYQIEMLDFLKRRFEQDVKLAEDLFAGDRFNDAFDVVSDFFRNATTEYASEASRIANLASKISAETARRMRRQSDELMEDLAAMTVG